ncbi:MAG: tRNA (adenosine(37)-N6)-dimethylallyltransferase MiaA, partial [Haliea sp.]|nr:tRNA (adenosine(37)-N6)-dimethylallyltransferase MiaA [Haliea sp.]
GSAKPDYPHHLIDIRDPAQRYSAAEFARDAAQAAAAITARGRVPILVGGTMLYFRALLEGLAEMPAADLAVRAALAVEAAVIGWPALHARLAEVDSVSAAAIHPHHSQRISRALEVFISSGVPLSVWHQQAPTSLVEQYHVVQLVICPAERALLHTRIAQRFEQMLEQGFLQEVAALRQRADLGPELPAMRAVGYRQLWQYLDGECTLSEATERGIAATRQLAKRQLTWLRKWPDVWWLLTTASGNVCAMGESEHSAGEIDEHPLACALKYLRDNPT